MVTVLRKEGGHQWIRHRFKCSIGIGKEEHPPEEHGVGILRRSGTKGHHRGDDVAGKGRHDENRVPQLVGNEPTDENTEAESGEPGPTNGTQLCPGESKLSSPVVKDSSADSESNAGCEDGDEPRPKEAHPVYFIAAAHIVLLRVVRVWFAILDKGPVMAS